MSAFVVDSSAVVDLLLHHDIESGTVSDLRSHDLRAPELIIPELLSAARRLAASRRVDMPRVSRMLEEYDKLEVTCCSHDVLMFAAWKLRDNFSAYDAMYVALAKQLEIPLVTSDMRLAKAARDECEVLDLEQLLQS